MRILHVHSGNLYGGVETFLATLARSRAFAPAMEMSVVLSFDGQIAAELRHAGVPVSVVGAVRLRRPDSVWRARRQLAAVLSRERYDVVICHQPWTQAIFGSVARSAAVPVVFWVHMAWGRHWLNRLSERVTPDLIVCNSRFTASTLPKTSARVEVMYAPVAGATGAAGVTSVTNATGAGKAEVVIIQVGRMEPLKGHTVCLEALARLRERSGWLCWQVGGVQRPEEERYLTSLRTAAERLGIADRVRFLGHRSDVPELLSQAHIYCQPNVEPEAFGISLIEALAAGLPVVTSGIGGALEIVDDTCGALVHPRDPASLASTLAHLLDDSIHRERLGRNGRARARALCDPAVQMPRIAELLASVSRRTQSRNPRAAQGNGPPD